MNKNKSPHFQSKGRFKGKGPAHGASKHQASKHSSKRPSTPKHEARPVVALAPERVIYGLHAAEAALLNPKRRIKRIWMVEGHDFLTDERFKTVFQHSVPKIVQRFELDMMLEDNRMAREGDSAVHQGIVIEANPLDAPVLEAFVKDRATDTDILIILDQVTDPHNVGAILRSACVFGAAGVVVQDKNTPLLTATAVKIACGAAEHVPVFREVNLSRTLEMLQTQGYWCMGLDERGEMTVREAIGKSRKIALVMGAEGPGLRRLVAEHCDQLVKLPTYGALSSLNVSNAAAIALYETAVQIKTAQIKTS